MQMSLWDSAVAFCNNVCWRFTEQDALCNSCEHWCDTLCEHWLCQFLCRMCTLKSRRRSTQQRKLLVIEVCKKGEQLESQCTVRELLACSNQGVQGKSGTNRPNNTSQAEKECAVVGSALSYDGQNRRGLNVRGVLFSFTAFKMIEGGQAILQKIVYLFGNLACLALALYKCSSMGLLPTHASDWLDFVEPLQASLLTRMIYGYFWPWIIVGVVGLDFIYWNSSKERH